MDCKVKFYNGLGEIEVLEVEVVKGAYDSTAWSKNDLDEVVNFGRVFKNEDEALEHVAEVCDLRDYAFYL